MLSLLAQFVRSYAIIDWYDNGNCIIYICMCVCLLIVMYDLKCSYIRLDNWIVTLIIQNPVYFKDRM